VISYGNGCDLNESDFLHYLTNDEETKIICVYIEGVKDGQLFRQALTKASNKKPVILLKGGSTKNADRIIMAHTGSMKSDELIWEALLKQNGILQVHSMEEMVDMAVALTYIERPNGKRAGVVGWGGGASVMAVDECTGEGLEVPTFSEEIQQQLRKFSPRAGSILLNPVDSVSWVWNQKDLFQTILTVADWPGIDFIIMHLGVTGAAGALSDTLKILPHAVDTFIKAKQACNKPMAVVLHSSTSIETDESFLREEQKCIQAGLATFPSIIRAARAINRLAEYTLRK
jgi:acyl-CoA synthetase (NDP forming)